MIFRLFLSFTIVLMLPAQAAWFNGDWSSREKITIKASRVNGDLSEFPVYLNLADLPDDFFTTVNGQGADIRITQADGVLETAFELVDIDAVNGSGELWFKAPALSSSVNTDFFIYYGNQGAVAYADSDPYGTHNVWSNGFVAVYHLNEDPSLNILDSSSHAHNGTQQGGMLISNLIDGKIGKALEFDGVDDFLDLGAFDIIEGSDSLSLNLWVKQDSYHPTSYFRKNNNNGFNFQPWTDSRQYFSVNGTTLRAVTNPNVYPLNKWYNTTATFGSDRLNIYNEGRLSANSTKITNIPFDVSNLTLAYNTSLNFNGAFDEVQISLKTFSEDWIASSFENQNITQDFYLINNGHDAGFDQGLWTYSQKITIPASEINSDLMDFPVYLNLADLADDFFAIVQSDGRDIRITKADKDSQQVFELVEIDTVNGSGELWFRADELSSSQENVFYIWCGNSQAQAYSRSDYFGSENVWSNNFFAVYHLNEDPSSLVLDSTRNHYHMISSGAMNSNNLVDGKLGQALSFDGVDDILRHTALNIGSSMTSGMVSAWAKTGIHFTSVDESFNNDYLILSASTKLVFTKSNNVWHRTATDLTIDNQKWNHLNWISDGTSWSTFINANSFSLTAEQQDNDGDWFADISNRDNIAIGGYTKSDQSHFLAGIADELKIHNTIRSLDWIRVEYQNQNSPGNFYLIQNGNIAGFDSRFWSHKHKISIPAAVIASDLEDFPVYVNLADLPLTFFSRVQASGADIRVTKVDQKTQLAFELVDLDTSNFRGELWFKADLLSSANDNDFYIWYNNPQAQAYDRSDEFGLENVWTKGYVGVWHMNEDPSQGQILDSTFYANHGVPFGSMTTDDLIQGKVGKAIDFDGLDDEIRVAEIPAYNWTNSNGFTASVWAATHTLTGNPAILRHGNSGASEQIILDLSSGSKRFVSRNSSFGYRLLTTGAFELSQWTSMSMTWNGTNLKAFEDAEFAGQGSHLSMSNIYGAGMSFGGTPDNDSYDWDGWIDEVRVSNVTRSNSWLELEAQNQKDTGTFYTVDNGELNATAWSHIFKVTILASQVNGDLTDFPVYLDLADLPSEFFNVVANNGEDLRVVLDDQKTQTAFELVSIDTVNGQGELWFKAPFLSGAVDTDFYLLAGNPNVQAYSRDHIFGSENVWSNGFVAVYHMNNDLNIGLEDSTGYRHYGTANGSILISNADIIGQAGFFNGSDSFDIAGNSDLQLTDFNLSVWVQPDEDISAGHDQVTLISYATGIVNNRYGYGLAFSANTGLNSGKLDMYIGRGSSGTYWYSPTDSTTQATWLASNRYMVSINHTASNFDYHINGVAEASGSSHAIDYSNTSLFQIGSSFYTKAMNIDEVRISNKTRQAAWINTQFNNQNSPATFYTIEKINRGNAIMQGRMF